MTTSTEAPPGPSRPARRVDSTVLLVALLVAVLAGQRLIAGLFDSAAVQTWATVFVAVCVQAVPFLVLGVLVSAAIAAFVPPSFFQRVLPKREYAAVPVAGVAGVLLPGCECGSVPVAAGLVSRGVPASAALAFLLSAPAVNPVVLVATAVAFPGRPGMVAARFAASLLAAVVVGWLWARFGRTDWMRAPRRPSTEGMSRRDVFRVSAGHDFLQAGGFLVVGGLTAATLNVLVPQHWLTAVAGREWLSIAVLSLLAVLLAICSEADAFVAASLSQFSLTARLAFLVVGPMVDVKLVALQAGTFGRRFAVRFAPLVFVTGVLSAVLVGEWLL